MKKIFYFYLLVVLLVSCSDKGFEGNEIIQENEVIISEFSIKLDSVAPNTYKSLQTSTEGAQEYLIALNSAINSLDFYKIPEGGLYHRINLAYDGPNGVGRVRGFNFIDWQNIYLFPLKPVFYKIDSTGKVLQAEYYHRYDSTQALGPIFSGTFLHQYAKPINNGFSFVHTPATNWDAIDNEQISFQKIEAEIDTVNKTIIYNSTSYPKNYWKNGKLNLEFSRAVAGDSFIYSFKNDNSVYLGNKEIPLKHSLFPNAFKPQPQTQDIVVYQKYLCETPSYGSVYYDANNDFIIRFAFFREPSDKPFDPNKLLYNPSNQSILIADTKQQKIWQIELSKNTYLLSNAVMGINGLYVAQNHAENKNLSEKELKFSVFSFNELK